MHILVIDIILLQKDNVWKDQKLCISKTEDDL